MSSKKITQFLKKVAKTVTEPKKCKNICDKAKFESPKHLQQTPFETNKYIQQTSFETAYVRENIKK